MMMYSKEKIHIEPPGKKSSGKVKSHPEESSARLKIIQ